MHPITRGDIIIRNSTSVIRSCTRPPASQLLAPCRPSLTGIIRSHSTEAASSPSSTSPGGGSSSSSSSDSNSSDGVPKTQRQAGIPEVRAMEGAPNIFIFRLETFDPELPLVMRNSHQLPAMARWFEPRAGHGPGQHYAFKPRLTTHSQAMFPYELTDPSVSRSQSPPSPPPTPTPTPTPSLRSVLTEFRSWLIAHSNERYLPLMALIAALTDPAPPEGEQEFRQFDAPLGLLARACEFNAARWRPAERLQRLYVAQSALADLPGDLAAADLPAPALVRGAGRGDVYGSSVWLGLEPTYTPLHRDPNPNLFCQLLGAKQVRLLPPAAGQALYERVRAGLGTPGSSRLRGAEMMGGPEREALQRAVWGEGVEGGGGGGVDPDMQQTVLRPGDTMFIPKGWWHSIRSTGTGVLNASANWWFR